jgi:hypothetical protein
MRNDVPSHSLLRKRIGITFHRKKPSLREALVSKLRPLPTASRNGTAGGAHRFLTLVKLGTPPPVFLQKRLQAVDCKGSTLEKEGKESTGGRNCLKQKVLPQRHRGIEEG